MEALAGSANNVSYVLFILVGRNDRGGLRPNLSERIALRHRIRNHSRAFIRRAPAAAGKLWSRLPLSSRYDWMKVGRVIRTADQRARGDMEKAFSARNVAVVIELLGRDVLDHR